MGFVSLIHFYSWLPGTGENNIVYGRVGFVGLVEMFGYGGVSGVPCVGFSMLSLAASHNNVFVHSSTKIHSSTNIIYTI